MAYIAKILKKLICLGHRHHLVVVLLGWFVDWFLIDFWWSKIYQKSIDPNGDPKQDASWDGFWMALGWIFNRFSTFKSIKNRSKINQQIIKITYQQKFKKVKIYMCFTIYSCPRQYNVMSKNHQKSTQNLINITSQNNISITPHFHLILTPISTPKIHQNLKKISKTSQKNLNSISTQSQLTLNSISTQKKSKKIQKTPQYTF